MELPAPLRQAVDEALAGVPPGELARAAEMLSIRYRAERRDGRRHLDDDRAALAYLATRLPATYAATQACFAALAEIRPDFAPRSLLDIGAGPGTALWAAVERWPGLEEALLVEESPVMRRWGERLAATIPRVAWRGADIRQGLPDSRRRDLVVLAYVLGELDPDLRPRLIERLWAATGDLLVLVEPGTPAGWQRILAARARLLAVGAAMVAPCPHGAACPLLARAPDWCHFARRLPRSRAHRQAKGAEAPWEDEKFIYLAVSRQPALLPDARIIAPPRVGRGHVRVKLCLAPGGAEERVVSRREGGAYKQARRAGWGEALFF
jgi:ribosomal protein RSM22 (predicted rRNA methylase)